MLIGQRRPNLNLSSRTLSPRAYLAAFVLLVTLTYTLAAAQKSQPTPTATVAPTGTPKSWVEAAVANELLIINDDGDTPLRYRIRKIDPKGDTTRIQIESRQGDVARLIERNGHPITPTEDAAERDRLNTILTSPSDFLRHHKRDSAMRSDVNQLVRLLPTAMTYSFTPGQPQLPGATPQIAIDFRSNPNFKPPTMLSESLTGIEGRMWIDATSRRVTRIEGHFLKTVNFGFGIVARIFPGGTIELEQTNAGGDRWVYSHLVEHLTVRAMMVKTIPEDSKMTASDFQLLPKPVDFQEAVRQLLAMPIPTQ
jgi:hypothetical protein